jgi:hypothetical protein
MKNLFLLLAFCCTNYILSAQNWYQPDKSARLKYISVGSNNKIWGVSSNNQVYRWNGTRWEEPDGGARLKQISVASDDTVWGVASDDRVYRWTGTRWEEPTPGAGLKHISVGRNNSMWGVASDDRVYRWSGTRWEEPDGSARLKQISVASDGTVWGVNSIDLIWMSQSRNETPAPAPTSGSFTFLNEMSNAVSVSIYKENGTQTPDFIIKINNSQSYTVENAKIGDTFKFDPDDKGNLQIAPYTISTFGGTHRLKAGTRYLNNGARKVNTRASEHSFDFFKIDPIYIAYTASENITANTGQSTSKIIGQGGMRKQIFKSLVENDLDWETHPGDQGNVALKNHFTKITLNEGNDKSTTENCYSDQAFKQSFTGSIGVSGGNEKSGQGGGSASFSYTTENSSSTRNIYTYSRSSHRIYSIDLQPAAIDLTDEFKNAVKSLPETAGSAYNQFIKDWGTHYPTKVDYGGLMIGVMSVDEKTYMQSKGYSMELKAEVAKGAKVEVGGGYSTNESFNQMHSKAKSIYYYKGGSGGSAGSWSNSEGTAQPMGIKLSRLNELLKIQYFNIGLTQAQIDSREKLLAAAITTYIGSPSDPEIPKPRIFKISNVRWKMIEEHDNGLETSSIFGNVNISLVGGQPGNRPISQATLDRYRSENSQLLRRGAKPVTIPTTEPHRYYNESFGAFSKAEKEAVKAPKDHVESATDKEIVFYVPRAYTGSEDLSKYFTVTLAAELWEYDAASASDFIGKGAKIIKLSDIGSGINTIKLEFRGNDGYVDVMADIEEIALKF